MYLNDAIQKIFTNSGALFQVLEGQFFILSDIKEALLLIQKEIGGELLDFPQLYKPTFFNPETNSNEELRLSQPRDSLKTYQKCLSVERSKLVDFFVKTLNENLPTKSDSFSGNDLAEKDSPDFDSKFAHNFLWQKYNRTYFEDDFQKIQSQIQSGLIDKAVLMTSEQSSWKPNSKEHQRMILNLLQKCPPHLYIYSHWDKESGVVGASPELLFYRNEKKIQSMALAGTQKHIKGALDHLDFSNNSLLTDAKEQIEHHYVVEDLRDKLASLSLVPTLSKLEVIELPHLLHLQTKLHLELDELPLSHDFDYKLTQKLHPTAALGIRSKKIHWHWLRELKGHQNLGYFGAPVGLPLSNGFICLVGIRNLEWTANNSFIRAGCGIVSQSQMDKEWNELEAKRDSVKSLLGLM